MKTLAKRRPPWWLRNAVAFLVFVLFDASLMSIGLVVCRSSGRSTPVWVDLLMWSLATPVWAVRKLKWYELFWPLVWINPYIYGAVWWLMWRVARLMRSKLSSDHTAS